jgi:hypothetical protein
MSAELLLKNSSTDPITGLPLVPSRTSHDLRRSATYPGPVSNSWFHLCNSEELPKGKVLEIRALNCVFALWRDEDENPVVQSAFCIHLGANIAVGGKVNHSIFSSW